MEAVVLVAVVGEVVLDVVVVVVLALQLAVKEPVPPTCSVEDWLFCEETKSPPVVDQDEKVKPGLGL